MPLTIFKRLVIGNIAILVLVLLLGGVVSFNLKRLQQLNHEVLVKNQESIFVGERLMDAFDLLIQFDEKYFVASDIDYYHQFNKQKSIVKNELSLFSSLIETREQKALLAQSLDAFDHYQSWFDQKVNLSNAGDKMDFNLLDKERSPVVLTMIKNWADILTITRAIVTTKTKRSGQMTQQILMVTIITTILTVLSGMVITVLNTRSIKNSVVNLQKKTKEIARGHFEEIHTLKGPKEIQDLALHFNSMCQRLKELDHLKADFISHVSHELRTPLTSIKEASTMLSKGFYKSDPDKEKLLLGLIEEECQRLLKSVMRILDYSKMEARKMEYQTAKQELPDVLRKSILKLVPLAQKKNISMDFSPPRPGLPNVNIDEDRIIEVLDNIIGNAIKFTHHDGIIKITCRFLEKEGSLQVSIEDNGPGIQLEHLEKIFYKFEQIDNDLNTLMGTGLGLSISKYIIKAHGGKIWAQSQESKGTTILFTLPAAS